MEAEVHIGSSVVYTDEFGKSHNAVVTQKWGNPTGLPSINLVWVSNDEDKTDSYGRQIERNTSVPHTSNQSAPGRFWDFPE